MKKLEPQTAGARDELPADSGAVSRLLLGHDPCTGDGANHLSPGAIQPDLRASTSQKCEAVPRRARI